MPCSLRRRRPCRGRPPRGPPGPPFWAVGLGSAQPGGTPQRLVRALASPAQPPHMHASVTSTSGCRAGAAPPALAAPSLMPPSLGPAPLFCSVLRPHRTAYSWPLADPFRLGFPARALYSTLPRCRGRQTRHCTHPPPPNALSSAAAGNTTRAQCRAAGTSVVAATPQCMRPLCSLRLSSQSQSCAAGA